MVGKNHRAIQPFSHLTIQPFILKKLLTNVLQFLLFLSIGAVILYLVYKQQNTAYLADCALRNIPAEQCDLLEKLATDFRNANFGWIALVALVFLLSNVSRTLKWQLLLHPLGYRPRFINGYLSILVGYFANLGLPRMGEVVRAGVFAKYEHIPAEKVMGTIVVDRIVDVLCLLVTFGLALIFESEKLWGYLTGGNLDAAKEAALVIRQRVAEPRHVIARRRDHDRVGCERLAVRERDGRAVGGLRDARDLGARADAELRRERLRQQPVAAVKRAQAEARKHVLDRGEDERA